MQRVNEPPPHRRALTAMARHPTCICHDPNHSEKNCLDHPMPRTHANMGIKKMVCGEKLTFHPIFSHLFLFYYRMAALNPVFHDDLKTRNNLGAAHEIRLFLDLEIELK